MPKARQIDKPENDPYWPRFVKWMEETRGGMHDHWHAQWAAFKAGVQAEIDKEYEWYCAAEAAARESERVRWLEALRTPPWPL